MIACKKWYAGCKDVIFVYIEAVDKNETVVPDYEGVLNIVIDGDASVLNTAVVRAEAGLPGIGQTRGYVHLTAKDAGKLQGDWKLDVQGSKREKKL